MFKMIVKHTKLGGEKGPFSALKMNVTKVADLAK